MTKFTVVKQVPSEIGAEDYVINGPSFLQEIELNKKKNPRNQLTALFHLRGILDTIYFNYDPDKTSYSVRTAPFEGRPFNSDEELDKILVDMIGQDDPTLFKKYLDKKIKTRPKSANHIWYVDNGIKGFYEIFYQNGIPDSADEERANKKAQEALEKAERSKKWKEQQEAKKAKEQNDDSN
jgi:hypothetical protein